MVRTRVGYAGGEEEDPTYRSLGGHSETLQVDFDPEVISYRELLEVFWEGHDPTRRSWSSQYRSAIFTSDERQREAAEASKALASKALGKEIVTEITPLRRFYLAEDYHQKHTLRQFPEVMAALADLSPTEGELRESTLAARLNGLLAGYGTANGAAREMERLGAPASLRSRVLGILEKR